MGDLPLRLQVKVLRVLQLALDIKRYLWDDAMDTIVVTSKNPSVVGAPDEIVVPFVFDREDQWVLAIGADYRINPRWTVRAGFNHGDNPVPDETMNPLFPAIVEDHVSIGAGWLVGNKVIDFAVEHALNTTVTNNNPNPMLNPFGPAPAATSASRATPSSPRPAAAISG